MFWSWYHPRNFGDWIGPYLFESLTGSVPNYIPKNKRIGSQCLYTVGSILRHIQQDDYAVVWGSGIISRADSFRRPLATYAVRGPFSHDTFYTQGYDCPPVFGDPAILLSDVYKPDAPRTGQIGIIPHYFDYKHFSGPPSGIRIIDVTRPVEMVANEISACEFTISSSLHGIIVSHSYGISCVWVQSIEQLKGDGIKFKDYYAALELDLAPQQLPHELSVTSIRKLERHACNPSVEKMKRDLATSCPFPGVYQ
jgi:hypothetical protein